MNRNSTSLWAQASTSLPCPTCAQTDRCLVAPDGRSAICCRSASQELWLTGNLASGDTAALPNLAARRHPDRRKRAFEIAAAVETANAAKLFTTEKLIGGPVLVNMEDVHPCEVSWLWPGRIPLGCITLLVGRPGEGKSFLTTDIAARVTLGTPWPDGRGCAPLGSVLFISAEDDPANTIRPRLDAASADPFRVKLLTTVRRRQTDGKIGESAFTLRDVTSLERALKSLSDCRLVVIDPIGSFLGGKVDAHRDNEVREVLAPIAALAAKYGSAVLIVAHRRKSAGESADDLAMGSRAFTGIARAVWHLSRDQANPIRRLLLSGKMNSSAESSGLAFVIDGNPPAIRWELAPVELSADDGLAREQANYKGRGREPETLHAAKEWLREQLSDFNEHSVAKLRAASLEADVGSSKTLQRAAKAIGAICTRRGFGGGVCWQLPKVATNVDDRQTAASEDSAMCPSVQNDKSPEKTAVFDKAVAIEDNLCEPVSIDQESNDIDEYARLERQALKEPGM